MRTLFFLLLFTVAASAQVNSFFDAGLAGSYGSNQKKLSLPEIYGGLGFKFAEFKDSTVQVRLYGRYAKQPQYADLFTRDDNPERTATGDLNARFGLRWNLSTESYFKPFVEGGVEYTRHFGLPSAPQSALSPTLTFGARAGYGYEAAYTRLFEDRLNRSSLYGSSRLRGDRIGASYLFKVAGSLHFKFGLEADRVSYRACADNACDGYREYDWSGRGFFGVSIF